DEQKLVAEIKTEELEKQDAEKAASDNKVVIPDSLPSGFRFQEDRSADPKNPPVIIDISGTNENTRNFTLSDVSSAIKYIRLETPPDSTLLWFHPRLYGLMPSVKSDDNHLIIQGLYGVAQFTMNGKFQEAIWKNESGINVSPEFVYWNPQELFGVTPDNPVSLFKGNLYLRFQDGKRGEVQVVSQKIKNNMVLQNPSNRPESGIDTLSGDRLLSISEEFISKNYPKIFGLEQNCWAGIHDTWTAVNNRSSFIVFNNKGDTLCAISNPHHIKNWSKSLARAGEPFTYYFKNQLTYLGQYSDTLFRFIPPNRLLPVYIFDFGEDKVNFLEGIDPDSDLSQKLMLYSIFEINDYIFIRYTRNNASPQNMRNQSVTFYNSIFNKADKKLYHFPEHSFSPQNLKNDIDGGISFWPEFITPEGNMMMVTTGQKIKQYINSEEFKTKTLPEAQRQKQIEMASELGNTDVIVMIAN
ncbi:MAG: DUF4933 domain-containing protein, partial [Prolixibacteraceae bacterium]|nr:DUF4933 domain-containing protein [Prolixibacteraceae bacterium]